MIRRVDDAGGVGEVTGEARSDGVVPSDASRAGDREETERITRAVRRVLEIVPGERRLLPAFGCRIHALELESLVRRDSAGLAAGLVEEALERWLPGLELERAEVYPSEGGWIRVALRVSARWHELEIKHRGSTAAPLTAPARAERWLTGREERAR